MAVEGAERLHFRCGTVKAESKRGVENRSAFSRKSTWRSETQSGEFPGARSQTCWQTFLEVSFCGDLGDGGLWRAADRVRGMAVFVAKRQEKFGLQNCRCVRRARIDARSHVRILRQRQRAGAVLMATRGSLQRRAGRRGVCRLPPAATAHAAGHLRGRRNCRCRRRKHAHQQQNQQQSGSQAVHINLCGNRRAKAASKA